MAEQQRRQRPAPKERVEETEEVAAPVDKGEKLKGELDDLLDEIDEVLEVNAEDFVKSYVQKGGELTICPICEWDMWCHTPDVASPS